MTRAEIYRQMEETLGLVPTFFKSLPDSSLELEWTLFNRVQNEPGPIPNKYRELAGLAVAAVMKSFMGRGSAGRAGKGRGRKAARRGKPGRKTTRNTTRTSARKKRL